MGPWLKALAPLGFGASAVLPQRLLRLNSQWLYRSPDWHYREVWHPWAGFRCSDRPRAPRLLPVCFLLVELLSEVRETNFLVAHTLSHDAIVKPNARMSAAQFAHHEGCRALFGHIQSFAITLGCEEHVVFHSSIHGFPEDGLDVDNGFSVRQLSGTRIFEPVFRRTDGVQRHLARTAGVHGRCDVSAAN